MVKELDPFAVSVYEKLKGNHARILDAIKNKVAPNYPSPTHRGLSVLQLWQDSKTWQKVGKAGVAECYCTASNGQQGVVGLMGRVKVIASPNHILRVLLDPKNGVVKVQL